MLALLPLALTAAQKAGLAIVSGLFIVFALVCSIVVPARWPEFPGRSGLRPFVVATVVLFVGTMLAVFFLAREPKEEGPGHGARPAEARVLGAGAAVARP